MKQIGWTLTSQVRSSFWRLGIALMAITWATVSMAQSDEIAMPSGMIETAYLPAHVPTRIAGATCGKWTVVKSPDGRSRHNSLNSVSASAANNIWAVGGYNSGDFGPVKTLTERWNGQKWSVVRSVNAGAEDDLYGVATVSPTDVWAVGYFMPQLSSPQMAVIQHWDGKKWSVVPSPHPGNLSLLFGVRAVAANDVWAAGFYYNSAGNSQGLIEHWDGKKWTVVPIPNPGSTNNELHAFAVVSAKDIWVAGAQSSDQGNSYQTLIERWDGKTWSVLPSPSPGSPYNNLDGVTAISASDAWVVGSYSGNNFIDQTLAEHWDGKNWTVVPTSDIGPAGNYLTDVSALGTDVWAVGHYFKSGVAQTLVERWNGTQWSIVHSPNPGPQWDQLSKMTEISNTLWSVGYFATSNAGHTLVESFCQ
jgi:hypothetical protein